MKNTKRLLSILLALLMVLSLIACGGGEEPITDSVSDPITDRVSQSSETKNPTEDPGHPEDPILPPERPVDETAGKTYVIIQYRTAETPFGYSQDTQKGEMVFERIAEVEALYGCTIEFCQLPYSMDFPSLLTSRQFGEGNTDLVFADRGPFLRHLLGKGAEEPVFVDLLSVDHIIDFWDVDKWGGSAAREFLMENGHFYGVTPALWTDFTPFPDYQFLYNKEYLRVAGLPDFQEYWEQKKWDREIMLNAITSIEAEPGYYWGLNAEIGHVVSSTFLSTGVPLVLIDKVNADKTVEWSYGVQSVDAEEAFTWLKSALTRYEKHFMLNGTSYGPPYQTFCEGACMTALVERRFLLNYVIPNGPKDFGIITWAGREPNFLPGYLTEVSTVSIPTFAQNQEHSAFLMYDLFEGLGDVKTKNDVIAYYRETYSLSETDVLCLFRSEEHLQFFYYGKGLSNIAQNFDSVSSVRDLIQQNVSIDEEKFEAYAVPNAVAIEAYRQNGFFK